MAVTLPTCKQQVSPCPGSTLLCVVCKPLESGECHMIAGAGDRLVTYKVPTIVMSTTLKAKLTFPD